MSIEQAQAGGATSEFVVRPDGTLVGTDGAAGALAAALPYAGRLARRMGELADIGDLRYMEALGRRRLDVHVTWTPAGQGTYRATAHPVEARAVPRFTIVGIVDAAAALDHCLGRLMSVDGVVWSTVVTPGSRVVGARGEPDDLQHLEEVGNRMLAVLHSLEEQHASGFMRLRFEQGAVVGASIGRNALVAGVRDASDEDLLAVVDEVRAVLADYDLGSLQTAVEPEPVEVSPEDEEVAPQPAPPPLVGARFAGAGQREPRPRRRRRFGSQ